MRTRRQALIAATVAVAGVVAACGTDTTQNSAPGETTAPEIIASDWSSFAVLCSQVDGDWGPIMELGAGELLELDDPATQLRDAGCVSGNSRTRGDGEPAPQLWDDPAEIDGYAWYAVGTGSDRFDVRGTSDATVGAATITVTHRTFGEGCATTSEWRGALVLIVNGPEAGPAPTIEYRTEAAPCEQ